MAALDQSVVKEGVDQDTVDAVREVAGKYKHGWNTEIEMDYAPKGLNEDIVRLISEKNGEPEWMTEWRLEAYRSAGCRSRSPTGRWCIIPRSTIRICITTPRRNR